MSLATSAAPVAVRRPATAQLLLPAAGSRGTLPDTAAAARPLRTSSTSAGGTAASAALTAPCAGATGASQLVPAGYRKPRPHFQRALGGGCLREHLAGDRAKPEQAGPAVLLEGRAAEQLRQLPGGEPPREVHLEIAVLRVHETGGVREVGAVGGLDGGHAT